MRLKPPDLSLINRVPWLCEGQAYQSAMGVLFDMIQNPDRELDRPPVLGDDDLVRVVDGVHYVPVKGLLLPYENLFSAIYGATTLDVLEKQLIHAATHPQCRAVVLVVDSPGGAATGIAELADWLYRLRQAKPVFAIGRRMLSGAYWLAAACGLIAATETTSEFGSVGAVLEVRNEEGKAAAMGERIHVFSSGKLKVAGHRYVRMTEADMRYLQNKTLDLALQFFQALENYRPRLFDTSDDPDGDPRALELANGGTFYSSDAKAIGLIDGVRSMDAIHQLITTP